MKLVRTVGQRLQPGSAGQFPLYTRLSDHIRGQGVLPGWLEGPEVSLHTPEGSLQNVKWGGRILETSQCRAQARISEPANAGRGPQLRVWWWWRGRSRCSMSPSCHCECMFQAQAHVFGSGFLLCLPLLYSSDVTEFCYLASGETVLVSTLVNSSPGFCSQSGSRGEVALKGRSSDPAVSRSPWDGAHFKHFWDPETSS
jgi:hypothetical protein